MNGKSVSARKLLGFVFIIIGFLFGLIFFFNINFPTDLEGYFQRNYYQQFGPVAISTELLLAGIYLFIGHSKSNFILALFAFTAILDPLFNLTGLFTSLVPNYAMMIFLLCALVAIWIAFRNPFKTGQLSLVWVILSFILSTGLELFFNYI